MLEMTNVLRIKRGDREYLMMLPMNAPLGELHDVLFLMRSFVIEKINEAVKADTPKEQPQEEPKVEP